MKRTATSTSTEPASIATRASSQGMKMTIMMETTITGTTERPRP
jgi:hypothetical protein